MNPQTSDKVCSCELLRENLSLEQADFYDDVINQQQFFSELEWT